jgi:hypothetical protein
MKNAVAWISLLSMASVLCAPPNEGWEQIRQIFYDVPLSQHRTVISIVRVFKGTAYIMLVDGSISAMDKRGAQIQIAVKSWRPEAMKRFSRGTEAEVTGSFSGGSAQSR